jgi:NAD(P)-dependent dehydrogenase (short-subunit alcohol dehydrogenase family)
MPGRVQDKIAIVTGGGTGIGQGIAMRLAQEGAKVVVANRKAETGEETVRLAQEAAQRSGSGGTALFQQTDVTKEADCRALVEAAVSQFGGVDVLVNNAGIFPRATLEETTEELWDQIFAVNLKGVFFCCKYAMPVMRERGRGSVINIGSINAYVGGGNLFPYSISKGGLLTLTRNLASSWARHQVRVNFLNPGWVITPGEIVVQGREGHDAEWLEQQGKRMPLGRMQTPDDAAWAAVYLASDESAMVTGQALNVDGGGSMRG